MVTSSVPAEGKTTVALSLARTYALSGQRTIIIDCDLRKPAVHRQLSLDPAHGVMDYLSGKVTGEALTSLISIDERTGLMVMTGARASDVPTDQLLMGKAFEQLINAAVKNFDIVVLDTSPILPVVDGTHIARWADIITFVVRWANTSQVDARSAITRLTEAKREETEIVTLLNQQETMRSSYFNRYASYYQEG